MPWQIWSPEDFPKRGDGGFLVDYVQAYRIQVTLKQNQWTQLDPDGFYKDSYVTSWVDKQADEKEVTISARELATRICRDKGATFNGTFYPVGLMYCNSDTTKPEELKQLVEEGIRRNYEFRNRIIEDFETQFRVKSQGGPGRWTPNTYEKECYKMLNKMPPEVVNRPVQQTAPQVQIIQPDPAMIAQLVAQQVQAELAKRAAK
jgi:hypothetical protein